MLINYATVAKNSQIKHFPFYVFKQANSLAC